MNMLIMNIPADLCYVIILLSPRVMDKHCVDFHWRLDHLGQFHPLNLSYKPTCFNLTFKTDCFMYAHCRPSTFHHNMSFETGASEAHIRTFFSINHAHYKCITITITIIHYMYSKTLVTSCIGKWRALISWGAFALISWGAFAWADHKCCCPGSHSILVIWGTYHTVDNTFLPFRAINNNLLDNYQLKSLDGILEASVEEINIVKTDDGRLKMELMGDDPEPENVFDNFALRENYDRIIRCLGWTFDDSLFSEWEK